MTSRTRNWSLLPILAIAAVGTACSEDAVGTRTSLADTPEGVSAAPLAATASTTPGAGDKVVFTDNFDSYASAGDLRSYAKAGAISLVPGRSGAGKSVRFSYSASAKYNLLERTIAAAPDVKVRYWFRTSKGADPTATSYLTLFRAERASGTRWQLTATGSPLQMGVNDNSAQGFPSPLLQNVSKSPRFGTVNDGLWHELSARFVSGTTGYAQVWIDGQLVTDSKSLGMRHAAEGVSLLRFPGELGATPNSPFTIDIDDISVWVPAAGTSDSTSSGGSTPSATPVARVTVSPPNVTLSTGASATLTAATTDASGTALTGRTVSWVSSAPSIATVSSSGVVTAVAAGSATITATSEGQSGTSSVSVSQVPVATLSVSLASGSIQVGQTTQASASARDANGAVLTGRTVTWASSNPAIATVNASGVVTAVAAGSATITATSEGKSGSAPLSVTAPSAPTPAPVAAVSVSPASASLAVGQTQQLSAATRDASGATLTGRTITWSSSASSIASVSASGLVTAVAAGNATVTATSEGKTATSTITVTAPTAPTTPTAPTGAGEPTYSASTDKLIIDDSFDSYTGITSGTAFTSRYPSNRALGPTDNLIPLSSVVSLVPGRSGNAIRLSYGGQNASDIVVGPESRLGSVGSWNGTLPQKAGPYTHFFFTTYIRFNAGADPASYNGSGVKGFMFWASSGRYQNAINQLSADGRTRGVKGANPCNAQSGLPLYKTADGCAPLINALADGGWHRFTIEIYAGSDPSGQRGERYWIDGKPIYDDVGQPVGSGTKTGHYDYASPITHWMTFGNFVSGSASAGSTPFTIDIDGWTAWTK